MFWKSIKYIVALLICCSSSGLYAEIITDGSLGEKITLPKDANTYFIDSKTFEIGQKKGGNLFHSFEVFNLDSNEVAVFQAEQDIQNIFARVTNEQPSLLNGMIQSPTNLYFLNPAGIIFGDSAALNINGSFLAGTAHIIDFADSGKFHSLPNQNDLLTAAPLTSFGFLTDNVESIKMDGSKLTSSALGFIGGDIELNDVTLFSPAGRIDLVSVASQGTVTPTTTDIKLDGFELLGEIKLSEHNLLAHYFSGDSHANIDVSLPPETAPVQQGGNVFIRGGSFIMQSSSIRANNIPSGKIDIELTGKLELKETSLLEADDVTEGIFIQAAEIKMHMVNTESAQFAQPINTLLAQLAQIIFNSEQPLDIEQFSNMSKALPTLQPILTQVLQTAYQQALISYYLQQQMSQEQIEQIIIKDIAQLFDGTPLISVQDIVDFINKHPSYNNAQTSLQIKEQILNYTLAILFSFPIENGVSVSNSNKNEQGGKIEIIADTIDLTDSIIQTGTIATGNAGDIVITSNLLNLNGNAFINTSSTTPPDESPENSNILQVGDAGNISIQTNNLDIRNLSSIGVNSSFSNGDAGNLDIQATEDITISNQGYINSFNSGEGKAGNITIAAKNMFITEDSSLIGLAIEKLGGNIKLEITDRLFVTNSIIDTRSFNNDAGNIGLSSVILVNNAELLANSVRGNGGDVTISASQYLPSAESIINNTSKFGIDGKTLVNAPTTEMMQFEPQPEYETITLQKLCIRKCARYGENELNLEIIQQDISRL